MGHDGEGQVYEEKWPKGTYSEERDDIGHSMNKKRAEKTWKKTIEERSNELGAFGLRITRFRNDSWDYLMQLEK